MSGVDVYQSHPLPPGSRCIRVLDILPGPETLYPDNKPIGCVLRTISLDDQPLFTALSYVWGNDPPGRQYFVECAESKLQVTLNCYSALRHLQRKLGQLTIWVDAICINQTDLAEKAEQIPLMGDIYSMADLVYIWLGDGTSGTDRAMQYIAANHLRYYFENSKPITGAWALESSRWSWRRSPLPLRRNTGPWIGTAPYTSSDDLKELFSTSWISRVWTYQEILLASRPIVVCGDYHVSWTSIEQHLQLFDRMYLNKETTEPWSSVVLGRAELHKSAPGTHDPSMTTLEEYHLFLEGLQTWQGRFSLCIILFTIILPALLCLLVSILTGLWRLWPAMATLICLSVIFTVNCVVQLVRNNNVDLDGSELQATETGLRDTSYTTNDLINALYARQCRDQKDMAFGMWAILERQAGTKLQPPDYTKDVGDIYRSFTIYLGRISRSTDFLLYAAVRNIPNQPSWVADWASYNQQKWSTNVGKITVTNDCGGSYMKEVEKEYDQTRHIWFDPTETTLTVHAYQVATVSMCVNARQISKRFNEAERQLHLENARYLQWFVATKPDTFYSCMGLYKAWDYLNLLTWNIFLRRCRNKSAAQICDMLRDMDHILHPLHLAFAEYVRWCDYGVAGHKAVFMAHYAGSSTRHCYGWCSLDAIVGDQILRIRNLPQLVLVRPCEDDANSVRIISPIELSGALDDRECMQTWEESVQENRYVEYHLR